MANIISWKSRLWYAVRTILLHYMCTTKCLHYNDLQNTRQKAKDRATRTPLNTGEELRCSGRVGSSSSTSGTRLFTPVTHSMISHEWAKNQDMSKLTLKKTARSRVNNTEKQATLGTRQKTKTTKYINDTEN